MSIDIAMLSKIDMNTLERYKNIMSSSKYKEAFVDFSYLTDFQKLIIILIKKNLKILI